MIEAFVRGVSVWGPGLQGWAAARAVLSGHHDYIATDAPPPAPSILSAAERRRSGHVVRLALAAAHEAVLTSGLDPSGLHSIFATSNGDAAVIHSILETLVSTESLVSPTQFHNSVHNAAAGYWTIGTRSRAPATCLGCHDASFGAALLKAMSELHVEHTPVLLCVYDAPLPPPLDACRPTLAGFAAAFVLEPDETANSLARLRVRYEPRPCSPDQEAPRLPAVRALAAGNPAARSLRLLEALARQRGDDFAVGLLDGCILISVHACSAARASWS